MAQIDTSIYNNVQQLRLPDYIGADQAAAQTRMRAQQEQQQAVENQNMQREQQFRTILNDSIGRNSERDANGGIATDELGLPKLNHKAVALDLANAGFGDKAVEYVQRVTQVQQQVGRAHAEARKVARAEEDAANKVRMSAHDQLMVGLSRVPADQQAAAYAKWVAAAKAKDQIPADTPDQFDPAYVAMHVQKQISPEKAAELELKKEPKAVKYEKGGEGVPSYVAFNPATGQHVDTRTGQQWVAPELPAAEEGKVTGVKRDKQGNFNLAADVQTNLSKSRAQAEAAANAMPILDQLRKAVETGKTSESKVGAVVAAAGSWLPDGMKPEMTKANEQLEAASNALVGLLEDPRMKGNPVLAEAQAVKNIIADPTVSNMQKLERLQILRGRMEAILADHDDAYQKYDQQTRERLDANGLGLVGKDRVTKSQEAPKTAPARATNKAGKPIFERADLAEIAKAKGLTVAEVEKRIIASGGTIR